MAEVTAQNEQAPFKVEVTKNTKGYNWNVRVYGEDIEQVTASITKLEDFCKNTYGDKA